MATLIIPPLDKRPWPTLGPQVCEWIEAHAVYGPGELAGDAYKIEDEFRAQLYRAYEVYPRSHRLAGRRRFAQVGLEERKGTAKTEKAMIVAMVESHPEGPVRCDGWRKSGRNFEPVGAPIRFPYIPLVSYTVEQTEDLAWNVLRFILENSDVVDDYDIGLDRILVLDDRGREAGKLVPLAGSPNARDGARTTFQHFDEPHRMTLDRLKKAYSTMRENAYKRVGANAWTLTTSTAGEPGEDSVEEDILAYAEAVDRGEVDDPRLFFFRRFCPEDWPMDEPAQVRAALLEASGPAAKWSGDIDGLVSRFFEPKVDKGYFRRVWLNQWWQGSGQAFDLDAWNAASSLGEVIPPESLITAGFDGSTRRDCTALVVTDVDTGLQTVAGLWERPANAGEDWEIPRDEVDAAVLELDKRWELWRLYGDPYRWGLWLDDWAGKLGAERVIRWDTTKVRAMAKACREFDEAMRSETLTHAGDERYGRHVGNCRRRRLELDDDDGQPMWTVAKDRRHSERWIDAAVAGILSWRARMDAVAAGAVKKRRKYRAAGF